MAQNALTPEDIQRIAAHEAGHLLEAVHCGSPSSRIEWLVDERGSSARAVSDDFNLLPDLAQLVVEFNDLPEAVAAALADISERRTVALQARLRIGIAGVVAVAVVAGRVPSSADLREDATCVDDHAQALETARLLLGENATDDQVYALVDQTMDAVVDDLDEPRVARLTEIARRLALRRTDAPTGLILLDSRERDEIFKVLEPDWMPLRVIEP